MPKENKTTERKTIIKDEELIKKFKIAYYNIIRRCTNPNNKYYYLYGGKGIKCDWLSFDDFKNDMYDDFVEHCIEFGLKNTTIDRINNNGNYCKENCRWATAEEQGRNTSRNHRFDWNGGLYTLKEIYDMCDLNIAYKTFAWRIYNRGYTIEEAISIPYINQEHRYNRKGGEYILKEIYDMESPKVCYGTFLSRIYQSKWSIEDALNTPSVKGFNNKLLYANKQHDDR